MRNPVALSVQVRDSGRQLSNQPRGECGMDAGSCVRTPEDLRHTLAGGDRRHERQITALQTFDRANARKGSMVECVERVDALSQCVLEALRRREQRPEAKQLERRRADVVEHQQPIADAVAEALGVPARQRFRPVKTAPSVDGGAVGRCHLSLNGLPLRIDRSKSERVAGRCAVNSIVHKTLREYKRESTKSTSSGRDTSRSTRNKFPDGVRLGNYFGKSANPTIRAMCLSVNALDDCRARARGWHRSCTDDLTET